MIFEDGQRGGGIIRGVEGRGENKRSRREGG